MRDFLENFYIRNYVRILFYRKAHDLSRPRRKESTYLDSYGTSPKISAKLKPSLGILKNRVAAVRRTALPRTFMFARAWGGSPNKHETTHFRHSGNEWFLHFVCTNALLAPLRFLCFRLTFTQNLCIIYAQVNIPFKGLWMR